MANSRVDRRLLQCMHVCVYPSILLCVRVRWCECFGLNTPYRKWKNNSNNLEAARLKGTISRTNKTTAIKPCRIFEDVIQLECTNWNIRSTFSFPFSIPLANGRSKVGEVVDKFINEQNSGSFWLIGAIDWTSPKAFHMKSTNYKGLDRTIQVLEIISVFMWCMYAWRTHIPEVSKSLL